MSTQPLRIGSLDHDLTSMAGAIHRSLQAGGRMVWIDDQREIFIDSPEHSGEVHARWIVGTYILGHTVGAIEGDLRAMANERAQDSMLE